MGIYQFRPTAEFDPVERVIQMPLCRFTSAKYQLIFGLDLNITTVRVGVDSPNRGVRAKGRPLEFSRKLLKTPQTG